MQHLLTTNILLLIFSLHLILQWSFCNAQVECANDNDCETILRKGSECLDGLCTNPFHKGGCLKSYIPDWNKTRICNSDDPPSAAENGYCIKSPLDYKEIRVHSNDWEASFFQTWMYQIILSEMLDVPVSVEPGLPGTNVDLYNVNSAMDYATNADWKSLENAKEVVDCRKLKTTNESEHQSCAHLMAEVWPSGFLDVFPEEIRKGNIEKPVVNGGIVEQFWYMPKFSAERNPHFVNYLGLGAEENRQEVAKTFKYPTTWKEYCDEVSKSNCTVDDGVTARYPMGEWEETSMHMEGLFTGHFRLTEKNDCVKYPNNCTGFIADYPCYWWSFTEQQAYYNNIPLDSGYAERGSYSYSQLTQIWAAANATKSDLIMMWWNPDLLFQTYLGTDAEMVKVILPTPTQSCIENRVGFEDRCGADLGLRVGEPEGSCDYTPEVVQKVLSNALYEITHDPDVPEELWSPAYDVAKDLQVTSYQIAVIMDYWKNRGTDMYGFDARDATCRWVVENMDLIQSFIPETYPRALEDFDVASGPLFATAEFVSGVTVLLVLIVSFLVYLRRRKRAIHYIQIEFLFLLLLGLLLIALGAMVLSLPPTDVTCISSIWLMSLGYVIELVPLIIRIFAINQLVSVGKHMKRVRLRRRRLLGQIFGVCNVICGFLLVWTILDPPKLFVNYELTNEVTDAGERIIFATNYCHTEFGFWTFVNLSWQALFLFAAAVLSFPAMRSKEDMNGVKNLSALIYTQLGFVVVRLCVLLVDNQSNIDGSDLMAILTLVLSVECIAAVTIFIVPKILDNNEEEQSEQLPDLFPNCTIVFADISGFTAWCSLREPVQVFKFLEEIYGAFDVVADNYGVFKIETVGDCYVAATGLPSPVSSHAVDMAKYAINIMASFGSLTKELEVMYGPDTTDLSLRVGIHSGQVTGGFLKGKGARFQLFGDTMNTTERIEATGKRGCIHLSEATANLLIEAGKQSWIQKRSDKIQTKGKGEMQTYWLKRMKLKRESSKLRSVLHPQKNVEIDFSESQCFTGGDDEPLQLEDNDEEVGFSPERTKRLIDWNVQLMSRLLVEIVARREATSMNNTPISRRQVSSSEETEESKLPIEKVKEIIVLPEFDVTAVKRAKDTKNMELSQNVINQLTDYVTTIAGMYRENYFHNFEHASHVVMAVTKHMSRIVAPSNVDLGNDEARLRSKTAATLHDHTYGITSDPLTRFACVFSALIHDVDHPGVPNPQLIKEDKLLAEMYKERSVAEQNSFDLAWNLLMNERFNDLRNTIYCDGAESSRFRQLVINSIMATDLGDQELKKLRNNRWDKAFQLNDSTQTSTMSLSTDVSDVTDTANDDLATSVSHHGNTRQKLTLRDDINRKATIVIEHLIQASDVSHTMQHWHVYKKWNEQLFFECFKAYIDGRAETNPADGWYKGEIGFFDFYIIPLAKKLDNCGVFGVSSDENLSYAVSNRAEWEEKGREVVAEYVAKAQAKFR